MKFFDRFKKKTEDDGLKSIFTDLDGNKSSHSQYDKFEEYKRKADEDNYKAPEEKVKYKTFDPYGDDEDGEIASERTDDVITDDIINSVLNSVSNGEVEVNVPDGGYADDDYQEEVEAFTMDEDGNFDMPKDEDIDKIVDDIIDTEENEDNNSVEDAIDITDEIVEEEVEINEEDQGIYDSLFHETTIVGTQIYTYDIDKQLGGYNFSSGVNYRVGMEESNIGSIFTITNKKLNSPITIKRNHNTDEIDYYNEVAGLGYSYAAICGTKVEGIIICEPQYWNNTLAIRHITVVEESRGNGVAKQLISKAIEAAQHGGFRGLHAEVGSKNGAAIEFFMHNHFHITGTNTVLYTNSDMLKNEVGIFLYRAII